ncbi:hypothetical protein AB1Y20_006496 [Prymnesium parvum]|uniref:Uncharacterized protein n=1 Tax=Prymnesium parvum TaxID=97485 RepID=A0AB34IZY8_PRYPA
MAVMLRLALAILGLASCSALSLRAAPPSAMCASISRPYRASPPTMRAEAALLRLGLALAEVGDKPGAELFGAQRTNDPTFGLDPVLVIGTLAVVFPIVITLLFIGRDP